MPKLKYKTGDSFGQWELMYYVKEKKRWMARCSCGDEYLVLIDHLTRGNSTRCKPCYAKASYKNGSMTNGTYRTWQQIKQRCLNPNNQRFHKYGGAGIGICDRWLDFENFLADMGERPDGTSIDRIDNSKGYFPENCRWATPEEQYNNRADAIQFNGEKMSKNTLSKMLGIDVHTITRHMKKGETIEDIATHFGYSKCG